MSCSDNTYYAENTPTLMYIILIFINAAFMLFTVITSEPFTTNYDESLDLTNYYI